MDIDESEVSRLLRGDVPSGDPVWGDVSTFLNDVGTAYPTVSTTALEERHLEAVSRESRLVHAELRHPRQGALKRMFQGTHRILAGSIGALLIALTAGVGVASALGINPLEQLVSRVPVSSPVATPATPATAAGTSDPAANRRDGEPGATVPPVVPGSIPGRSPSATASQPSGEPTVANQPGKDAAKAEKKAEKDAAKAEKDSAKAAAKAKKDAEKAAKAKPNPSPSPSPSPSKGKKDAGDSQPGQKGGKKP